MTSLRDKAVIGFAVLGLLTGSGIAMADSHQEEKNDTVFNYGYDAENQFLIWNISSLDYQPDGEALTEALFENYQQFFDTCSLANGDGGAVVDGYMYDGGTFTLTLDGGAVVAPEGCEYLTNGGLVTGPNGQVNHGMFMKLFNSLYDGPHKGCLVRHLAHSDLGKTAETKVQTDPNYLAPAQPVVIDAGTIEFNSEAADCIHGKKDHAEATKGGPPDHVLEKKAAKEAEKWGSEGKPGKGPKNGG